MSAGDPIKTTGKEWGIKCKCVAHVFTSQQSKNTKKTFYKKEFRIDETCSY